MRKQGLPKSCRLTERSQFVRLFDDPRIFKARTFQAFWKKNERAASRLGITIKGRLSSVWRVRVKRAIREWFRKANAELGSVDMNIVIRVPSKLSLEFVDQLKKELTSWKG